LRGWRIIGVEEKVADSAANDELIAGVEKQLEADRGRRSISDARAESAAGASIVTKDAMRSSRNYAMPKSSKARHIPKKRAPRTFGAAVHLITSLLKN